jgi:hypothetical protein
MPVFSVTSAFFNRPKKRLDIKPCGPDAAMVGVKLAEEIPPAMVTTKPDHQGEHEGNR